MITDMPKTECLGHRTNGNGDEIN